MAINGIFILSELRGEAGRIIREIQLEYDPKLAATRGVPHVTLAGSSGLGPLSPDTDEEEIRRALAPIAESTTALSLPFGAPMQFMQTNIVILPLDPHGAIRELHDNIGACGLEFSRAKFTFTPHATLSMFPTHGKDRLRELLAFRIDAPAVIDNLSVYHTRDPQPSRKLITLKLTGTTL
jgi:2'-5' RNA ligase